LITSSTDATSSLADKRHDVNTIFQLASHGGNNILSDTMVSSLQIQLINKNWLRTFN
jgi:hypothetical protein